MESNKSMTRTRLLRRIEQLIDRGGDASSTRPVRDELGTIVRTLLAESAADKNEASSEASESHADQADRQIPVPLHEVAAYVDGSLDDAARRESITRWALTDPGLMMELVAAVQSRGRRAAAPPLAVDLRSRLLSLHSDSFASGEHPAEDAPVSPVDVEHVAAADDSIASPPRIEIAPLNQASSGEKAGGRWGWFFAACAAASVLFAVIGMSLRSRPSPDAAPSIVDLEKPGNLSDSLVKRPTDTVSGERGDPVPPESSPATAAAESVAGSGPAKAGSEPSFGDESQRPEMRTPASEPTAPNAPMRTDPAAPLIAGPMDPKPGGDREPAAMEPPADTGGTSTSQPESTWALTWTTIDGVLLRSAADRSGRDSTSIDTVAGVAEGTTVRLESQRGSKPLRLQTLPLCRAVAEFEGGGRMVLAADTQIDLTDEGTLDLQFGSFAMLEIDPPRVVRIGSSRDRSVDVRWDRSGELVVQRTPEGLQIDVIGGPARVAGKPARETRLLVDQQTLQPEVVEAVPERLPRWTQQRVDRIELGRNVLASLAGSPNVRQTLLQTLAGGQVQGQGAAILRGWLVASANGDLLELLASPDALTREAALQHLAAINPRDPRHRLLWFHLQLSSGNSRVFTSIRSFFLDLWSGRRPGPARRDELLRLLQAPEPATRVTAHFLLRSFFGPGPRFDIAASPQQLARAANGWRAVMRRAN